MTLHGSGDSVVDNVTLLLHETVSEPELDGDGDAVTDCERDPTVLDVEAVTDELPSSVNVPRDIDTVEVAEGNTDADTLRLWLSELEEVTEGSGEKEGLTESDELGDGESDGEKDFVDVADVDTVADAGADTEAVGDDDSVGLSVSEAVDVSSLLTLKEDVAVAVVETSDVELRVSDISSDSELLTSFVEDTEEVSVAVSDC